MLRKSLVDNKKAHLQRLVSDSSHGNARQVRRIVKKEQA
jgi:hypothetical protein